MGNWERFGAFNQDHQSSPVYKSQRQAWNQDRGSGQNYQPRGKKAFSIRHRGKCYSPEFGQLVTITYLLCI